MNSEGDKKKQQPKQSVLDHGTLRICSMQWAAAITERVATFVVLDLWPLRVVEGAEFKQLMNYIEPVYVVPSHTHITSICCKMFHAIKEELSSSLESTPSVTLITDIWTSRTVQVYNTVTVHLLTENWMLDSKVLITCEMTELHTGVHIA